MEYKPELYTSWSRFMEASNTKSDNESFMETNIQMREEMMFGLIMFLIM